MIKFFPRILALLLICGLGASHGYAQTVTVRWLKPDDGAAKTTCGIQEKELQKAVSTLQKSLHKAGLAVELGYLKFTGAKPTGDMASRLGLWINNKPFETWLQASVNGGEEPNPCLETVVEGTTYKLIPSDLIVKAGMSAAETMTKHSEKAKPTALAHQ